MHVTYGRGFFLSGPIAIPAHKRLFRLVAVAALSGMSSRLSQDLQYGLDPISPLILFHHLLKPDKPGLILTGLADRPA